MRIGGDKEVAALLGISAARLKMRISAGSPVPPYMRAPGSKFRRWDLDAAETWLAGFTIASTPVPPPPLAGHIAPRIGHIAPRMGGSAGNVGGVADRPSSCPCRRGRGRPTKRESLHRRHAARCDQ